MSNVWTLFGLKSSRADTSHFQREEPGRSIKSFSDIDTRGMEYLFTDDVELHRRGEF